MQFKRVVITGLGAVTPLGNTVDEYWKNLVNGKSGAAPITRFNAEKFKSRFACEVKGFNPEDYLDRKEARKVDAFSHYGIAASVQAIADSGITDANIDKNEVGVIWGSGIGGLDTFQHETFGYARGDGTPTRASHRRALPSWPRSGGDVPRRPRRRSPRALVRAHTRLARAG